MHASIKWLLVVLTIVLLEVAVLPHYLMAVFKPDLLLVLMVFLALRAPLSSSLPAAYGLGLLKDCLGGIYLGLHGFSFLAAYLVLKSLSDRLYVQSALLFVLTVAGTTLGVNLLNYLLLVIFSQAPGLLSSLLPSLVPHTLMNAFVASLVTVLPTFSRPWAVK